MDTIARKIFLRKTSIARKFLRLRMYFLHEIVAYLTSADDRNAWKYTYNSRKPSYMGFKLCRTLEILFLPLNLLTL
jgi:hypothetical protein